MQYISSLLDSDVYYNVATESITREGVYKLSQYNLCVDKVQDLPLLQKAFLSLDLVKLEKERTTKRLEAVLYEGTIHNMTAECRNFVSKYRCKPLALPGLDEHIEESIFPKILECLNSNSYYNVSTRNLNLYTSRNFEYSRCLTYRGEKQLLLYLHLVNLVEKRKKLLDDLELRERQDILAKVREVKEGFYLTFDEGRSPLEREPVSINDGRLKRDRVEGIFPLRPQHVYYKQHKKYRLDFSRFSPQFIEWFKENYKKSKVQDKPFIKERGVEDYLCEILEIGREGRQVPTLFKGRLDILCHGAIIELKNSSRWREAIAQLHEYRLSYKDHRLILILFGKEGSRIVKYKVCRDAEIDLYFFSDIYEEVEKATRKKETLLEILELDDPL